LPEGAATWAQRLLGISAPALSREGVTHKLSGHDRPARGCTQKPLKLAAAQHSTLPLPCQSADSSGIDARNRATLRPTAAKRLGNWPTITGIRWPTTSPASTWAAYRRALLPPQRRTRWVATVVNSIARTPERRMLPKQRCTATLARALRLRSMRGGTGRARAGRAGTCRGARSGCALTRCRLGRLLAPTLRAERAGACAPAQCAAAAGAARGQHREQTNSSGVGASSGTPPQRVCDQRAQVSHAIIRCPSSSRVPHSQATTQSSAPPAGAQAHGQG